MTDTAPYAELLSQIDERATAFRSAVAAAPDRTARVPGCPDWTLRDLVHHLGGVHRSWAATVRNADVSAPPTEEQVGYHEPADDDLLEWSAECTRLLLTALRDQDPDSPCWTWWAASGAPQTAGAVARHQVQEAAVHCYDAQETIGKPEPIPAAVAIDGVAEFISVGLSSMGEWPHRPARLALVTPEGPSWVVDLSPSGVRLDPPASGDPVATVHASAGDLILALYGRIPFDNLRVDGDREVLTELTGWVDND